MSSLSPRQRRVLALAWPLVTCQRGRVARIVLLALVTSGLVLLQAVFSKVLIDDGALAGNPRVLLMMGLSMLLAPLIVLGLEAANRFDHLELSSSVLFGLREKLFSHLQTLSPQVLGGMGWGDVAGRFDGDLAQVQRLVVDAPLALFGGTINLVLLLTVITWLDPVIAAAVVATIPMQLAATWRQRRNIEPITRELRQQGAALGNYFHDSMRCLKLVQTTNTEAARLEGLRSGQAAYGQALQTSQQAGFAIGARQRVAGTLALAMVLAVAGWRLMQGETTVGVLVAFMVLAGRASLPVNTLLGVRSGWQRARVSLERVAELLEIPSLRDEKTATAEFPGRAAGEIEIRDMSYRHEDGSLLFDSVSCRIPGGSKIAVLGDSGGGKSTLADMLRGYCTPQSGTVLIDGADIAKVSLADLRRRVAVVDQEPLFLPGSVAENLQYACPAATAAELADALEAAGLLPGEFLDRQPGGAHALMSRGERVRVALARAFLQRPAILVLDESLSAVEPGLALAIMARVDQVLAGCTRIVITHDRGLAGPVNRVIRISGGRLEEVADAG